MVYRTAIKMRQTRFEHVNRLLEIESFSSISPEEMDAVRAKQHADELLYIATFDNGVKLDVRLMSGFENYFTSPTFRMPDGSICEPEDEAGFELELEEAYTLGDDHYVVTIELTQEVEEWVILAEDSNGKIHFYHRMTDNEQDFIRDVRALPQSMNIHAVYLQKDVVEGAAGSELKV